MMNEYAVTNRRGKIILDPPLARLLFSDTRLAPLWMLVRILLGLSWLDAAFTKLDSPGWMETGSSLREFWQNAVRIPSGGQPAISYDWYRSIIQNLLDSGSYVWLAKLIAVGELVIGVALIIGAFVGIAAFTGAFMNWNLMMAGAASSNGLLGLVAILLILAWKVAGYYGADYFLLRWLGTPWRSLPPDDVPANQSKRSPSAA